MSGRESTSFSTASKIKKKSSYHLVPSSYIMQKVSNYSRHLWYHVTDNVMHNAVSARFFFTRRAMLLLYKGSILTPTIFFALPSVCETRMAHTYTFQSYLFM